MRASVLVGITALAATSVAVWHFGSTPLPREARRAAGAGTGNPVAEGQQRKFGESAPKDLASLATWLKDVPLTQRDQFIRESVTILKTADAQDRAKIREFLLAGGDVEIIHPDQANHPLSAEFTTTLRLYLLGLLEEFPGSEAISLSREILAKSPPFRESLLCLRALERHRPDGNRTEALVAMQSILPAAAKPATQGQAVERYIAEYDRVAEPIAHYRLSEIHPRALEMVKANPFMAGRYTQAVMAYPEPARDAAITELFADPAVATELLGASATRSADVWQVPKFRAEVARMFSGSMNDPQRKAMVASLAEPTGMVYEPKPLAAPKTAELVPLQPKQELDRAKARLAMIEALAPLSITPEVKAEVASAKTQVEEEIRTVAEMEPTRPQALKIPESVLRGEPASASEQ